MDKLQKLISDFLSVKFKDWKQYLDKRESRAFELRHIKRYSIIRIAQEMNYSSREINRILKSAREKVIKHIP